MNAIDSRAAEWIARLHAGDRAVADETALRVWLDEDPAHAAAFERLTLLWDMVPGSGAQPVPRVERRPVLTRRRLLLGMGGAAATCGSAVVGLSAAYAGTTYETDIGERRSVRLRDGSQLLLDAASRVTADAWPRYRQLWLERGRIQLSIAPNAVPFEVDAGHGTLLASAGRFDLRRDGGNDVSLVSIAGQARAGTGQDLQPLTSGDRLRAGPHETIVDRPDPRLVQAWIDGRAAFHEDTIAAVAAEANRYARTPLTIADAQTGSLRVSGLYRMGDNVALAEALASLHGLQVQRSGDRIILGKKSSV
ncbi:FecR family protein [Sphingomonas sp. ASY06-1R]|uniref:FecR family protein n=1 Tax=Sphingomonas sp. ASY06-1R TaxID=3445771 RepID=UPI003FA213FD